jgi:DNA-directed RNA polymerase sigma subunit (sigma70/sigma32)
MLKKSKRQTLQNPYEYSLEEVAKKLGISKECARQTEQVALRKLRKFSKSLYKYIRELD